MIRVALNYEEINWNPERVSNINPFISKYNWKGINYPSKIDDWKRTEKKNSKIVLNILLLKRLYEKVPGENTQIIIDFEKKNMLLLTNKELSSHQDAKLCFICGKRILEKLPKSINYWKVRDLCHYAVNI